MPVPRVVLGSEDPTVLGGAFLVTERVEGETIPRRILRDEEYAAARPRLARQCGAALAAIHSIDPAVAPGLEEHDQVAQFRSYLDGLGQPSPAFELGFRWLDGNRPPPVGRAVVHGDFRNGNLIVGADGLRAVLDWELAHLGDPAEDLGWLCVRAWRFGVDDRRAGGFGAVGELLAGYEEAGGRPISAETLRWWEVLGTLKWGVMCLIQAFTHLSGTSRSVELAAIGRRVCEQEQDVLDLVHPERRASPGPGGPDGARRSLHGRPTAVELVEAVREFLEGDVMQALAGRPAFHARVAANALSIVERELQLGPMQENAHRDRLAGLGVAGEAELAAAIRSGKMDGRLDETIAVVRETVRDRLLVANPRRLGTSPA